MSVRVSLTAEAARNWEGNMKIHANAVLVLLVAGILANHGGLVARHRKAMSGLECRKCSSHGCSEFVNIKDRSIMILLPSRTLSLGSEDPRLLNPMHTETLGAFVISQTEVTNQQFARFIDQSGYDAGLEWRGYFKMWGEDAPVVAISWDDATAYATWAGLRLPTEDEWEYAAAGETASPFPWGNTWTPSYTWQQRNSQGRAHAVGSKITDESPFGCLDMAGNVAELTASTPPRQADPTAGEETTSLSASKVLRGGSWYMEAEAVSFRCQLRGEVARNCIAPYIGFRCARDVDVNASDPGR